MTSAAQPLKQQVSGRGARGRSSRRAEGRARLWAVPAGTKRVRGKRVRTRARRRRQAHNEGGVPAAPGAAPHPSRPRCVTQSRSDAIQGWAMGDGGGGARVTNPRTARWEAPAQGLARRRLRTCGAGAARGPEVDGTHRVHLCGRQGPASQDPRGKTSMWQRGRSLS